MKKKLSIALPVSALLLILLALLLFFKGSDKLTFFQKTELEQMVASNPFADNETGEIVNTVSIAAANNFDSTPKNSYLWFLNRCDSLADYVEVDVAFNESNQAVLADSFDEVNENSVLLERVVRYVSEEESREIGLIINLREYSALDVFAAFICQHKVRKRTVIVGVDENSLAYVKGFMTEVPVLCDYDSGTLSSVSELKELGADGIICDFDDFSMSLLKQAREQEMLVWVRCGDEVYDTVKALGACVDGVISSMPEMACYAYESWNENLVEDIKYSFFD